MAVKPAITLIWCCKGTTSRYQRTYPLPADRRVAGVVENTTGAASTPGSKRYPQARSDYVAAGFTNVPTYQVIETQSAPARLIYAAYDRQGRERDRLVIEKGADKPGAERHR